jgi:hypothetical protein
LYDEHSARLLHQRMGPGERFGDGEIEGGAIDIRR